MKKLALFTVALFLAVTAGPWLETETGVAVHYGTSWGDWSGIAAVRGVEVPADHLPVAHWDCGALFGTGLAWFGGSADPVAVFVLDCTAAGDLDTVRGRGVEVEVPFWFAEAGGWEWTREGGGEGRCPVELLLFGEGDGNGRSMPETTWSWPLGEMGNKNEPN